MYRKNTSLFALCFSLFSIAQTSVACEGFPQNACSCPPSDPWYVVLGAGGSFSREAKITTDPAVWDFAQEGYDNDLGKTSLWYFGIGKCSNFVRLELTAAYRGDYHYDKYQTGFSTTQGFTGVERTRHFEVLSESVMFNAWLDGGSISKKFVWRWGCVVMQPFIGGGVGVNQLTLHDFHTIALSSPSPNGYNVASTNPYSTDSDFAWHAAGGLEANLTSRATLAVGYNYFHGGDLPFPNYIDSTTSSPTNATTVPPWNGRLKANELYAELRINV